MGGFCFGHGKRSVFLRTATMTEVSPTPSKAPVACYTIEAPSVLRSNARFNVAVNILEAVEPTTVKLILVGESLRMGKTVELQPMSNQLVTFEIPDLNLQEDYYLEANGTGGIEFKDKIKLRHELSKPLAYIQLDKHAYKCEDKVDYRVIFLDTNIKPTKVKASVKISIKVHLLEGHLKTKFEKFINLFKKKHEENIVTDITKIVLNNGVYTGQWKVPATASSGKYTVVVRVDDEVIATKEFQVIHYVPPKFEVNIKTAREVSYEHGQFSVAVQARHADGTPVKGLCTIISEVVGGCSGIETRPFEKSVEINGETDNFIINFLSYLRIEEDIEEEPYFTDVSIKLEVVVQEEGTQYEERMTELLTVKKTRDSDEEDEAGSDRSDYDVSDDDEPRSTDGHISIVRWGMNNKVDDDMQFTVHLTEATNYFVYLFIARGNIVKCELVSVENHNNPYHITVKATLDFMPRAFLLVYFIKDGQLHFDEIGFNMYDKYENQIELVAPSSAQVSDVVQFEVKSSPKSLIALMAVDEQSVVFNADNELDYHKVFKDLRSILKLTPLMKGYGQYPGLMAGLVTLTNATWEGRDDTASGSPELIDREHTTLKCSNRNEKKILLRTLQERDQVLGNWFFINLETDNLGSLKFEKQLPSNATTWLVSAFALNAQNGWALMKTPLKIVAKPNKSSEQTLPVETTGHYSIISPGSVHPNSKYNVAVSVEQVTKPCKIQLKLEGPDFEQKQEVEVQPMTMENVEFKVPNVREGDYKLSVEGVSGLIFSNSTELNYDDNPVHVYVQTDKATYKPGDLVQFRVIFLDEHMRPAQVDRQFVIFIKDADNNRLKQYSNSTLTKGVFSGQLQLSEFPALGSWTIQVQIDGKDIETKSFDVDKYVLPKYEVLIDAPARVAAAEEKLEFTVRAKYTFGKPVKGKATVVIKAYAGHTPSTCIMPMLRLKNQQFTKLHIVDKVVELNGKANLEFDMKDVLPYNATSRISESITITVSVEEELTGHKREGTAKLEVVPYRFIIDTPKKQVNYVVPETKFSYSVTVRNLADEPVTDTKYPVIISEEAFGQTGSTEIKAFLNKNGIATFELKCPSEEVSSGMSQRGYKVQYRDQSTVTYIQFSYDKLPQTLCNVVGIQLTPERAKLGDDIEIQLVSAEDITYCAYTIVAGGNIVSSGIVNLASVGRKMNTFKIRTTFDMMPQGRLYIYYIHNDDLKFFETSFEVEKEFLNKISIDAPSLAKPGENIALTVKTHADSFVGIMGVDQSVLLLKSGNDFNSENILNGLHAAETRTPANYLNTMDRYPGAETGLVTMTNAKYPYRKRPKMRYRCMRKVFPLDNAFDAPGQLMAFGSAGSFAATQRENIELVSPMMPAPPPRIRKQFLENWFFDDFHSFDNDVLTIAKTVPDTITSWIVTAFSLNPQTGFALTDEPTKIQTFRPFFITTNLPYSVKRGELVSIPVIVFNYMNQAVEAEITLTNDENEFEFSDPQGDTKKRVKLVSVKSNNAETVTFSIRPKRMGRITLKITALSPLAGDAVHKELRVEPEGITIFKNHDFYVQNSEERNFKELVELDIPAHIVPDSEHIEISVMGDILGSTVKNLDGLVRMPCGCGEQNMVNFVPNILVLRYLESTKQLNPFIEAQAKRYMEIGYQRELSYKHDNGSYSAFGKSDKAGSTWLTAYVVRSFHQAAKYIDIDPKLLEVGLEFLASKQTASGNFEEHGKLFDFTHLNDLALTSFVLLAFLENEGLVGKYADVIDRGFKYLQEKVKGSNDLYALSLAVYAIQLRKLSVAEEILSELKVKAKIESGHQWWSTTNAAAQDIKQCWRPESHDVEITGYILMTLLERNEAVQPLIKWLIAQRNSNGGFTSTQETVVGMQALISFAEKTGAGNPNLLIEFGAVEDVPSLRKFEVIKGNALTVQTAELNNSVRAVKFEGKGTGIAILQVSYRYNIVDKEDKPSFKLTVNSRTASTAGKLDLDICTEYVPLQGENELDRKESNMVVLEVALPSGYTAVPESFDKVKEVEGVKLVETKKSDTEVIIYFDSLTERKPQSISIEAELTHEVADQKPVPVVIYDYYDSLKRATEFYSVKAC